VSRPIVDVLRDVSHSDESSQASDYSRSKEKCGYVASCSVDVIEQEFISGSLDIGNVASFFVPSWVLLECASGRTNRIV